MELGNKMKWFKLEGIERWVHRDNIKFVEEEAGCYILITYLTKD